MDVIQGPTLESQFPSWPEGFDSVTCPNALMLVGETMLCRDTLSPTKVKETFLAIASETYKNHINVNQACRLITQIEMFQDRYIQLCDLAAIHGGGMNVLEHKYLYMQYFKGQLEQLIESLELYRSLDGDLDERKANCSLPNFIEINK